MSNATMILETLPQAADKAEALALCGTLDLYRLAVSANRTARLAERMRPSGERPQAGDCTCPLQRLAKGEPCDVGVDGDDCWEPAYRVHCQCGGVTIKGKPPVSVTRHNRHAVEAAREMCECEGHAWEAWDESVNGAREALAAFVKAWEAWEALSEGERASATARDTRSSKRPQMHVAGDIKGDPMARLAEALGIAPKPAPKPAPETLAPAISEAISEASAPECTCLAKPGQPNGAASWGAYGAARKACQACNAVSLAPAYVPLSVPAMSAGVIRGDRVASKGRSATLGAAQGGQRIGPSSPLAC